MPLAESHPIRYYPHAVISGAVESTSHDRPMIKNQYATIQWIGGVLAATIFLSAFLVFQIQPLMGRYILPWFGGMPEVWTACMLFFQVFLLGGYAYAHALHRLPMRWQATIHTVLVLAAAATLSVIPDAALKPTPADVPVVRIVWICAICVGAAYFVLTATSPLVQSWFSQALPGRDPYRLYALSNIGSLLALGSFPFVFEPLLSRDATAAVWSWGFYGYAGLAVLCAATLIGIERRRAAAVGNQKTESRGQRAEKGRAADKAQPARRDWVFWLLLPMAASVELLAVTNKVTLDIAVIPFLWVLPLSLYLLSFILCFDHPRWYQRGLFLLLLIAGILGHVWVGRKAMDMHVVTIITIYAVLLFSCCMICHGELYRLRPARGHLTHFYLMVALGGALGGVFVAVAAPLIFKTYHELHLGILATVLCVLMCEKDISPALAKRRPWWVAALCLGGAAGIVLQGQRPVGNQRIVEMSRNFFGVLTILEENPDDPARHKRLMQHGSTFHGLQFIAADKQFLPTSYYSPDSGVGLLLRHWPKDSPRRIGVVGLGVGTIAAYGSEGDLVRFYEINPEVIRMARQYFSYLDDSDADIEVVLGDARLSMTYESPQRYDVLALDAFSSDAIPVHLLTAEAFEVYLSHLAEGGVLAVHISTQHLDLQSVIWKLAEHFKLTGRWIETFPDDAAGAMASDWILLSRDGDILDREIFRRRQSTPYADLDRVPFWTDDHVNLLGILKKKAD